MEHEARRGNLDYGLAVSCAGFPRFLQRLRVRGEGKRALTNCIQFLQRVQLRLRAQEENQDHGDDVEAREGAERSLRAKDVIHPGEQQGEHASPF
jgi:hypothetical protein